MTFQLVAKRLLAVGEAALTALIAVRLLTRALTLLLTALALTLTFVMLGATALTLTAFAFVLLALACLGVRVELLLQVAERFVR